MDTRDGDPGPLLDEVASAVDFWFNSTPSGLHRVSSLSDVEQLVKEGILAEVAPPRPPFRSRGPEVKTRPPLKDRLRPLIALPAPGRPWQ